MGNSESNNSASGSNKKDLVILHQFSRSLNAPSVSPFALKLETWFIIIILINLKFK